MARLSSAVIWLALGVLGSSVLGCVTPRLKAEFNDESLVHIGSDPGLNPAPRYPLPNPPNDEFQWGLRDITAHISLRPSGGKWVIVQPTASYLDSGQYRAFVMYGLSEAFTIEKPVSIRGGVVISIQ